MARGNDQADVAANKGRELHPAAPADTAERVKWQVAQATIAAKVMAATLPLWSRLERGQERTKAGPRRGWALEAPQPAEKHQWIKGVKDWHCVKCLRHARGETPCHK